MARRSYLQRIAEPLRAGDPVVRALPRPPAAEVRAPAEMPLPRAVTRGTPPLPDRRAAPSLASALDHAQDGARTPPPVRAEPTAAEPPARTPLERALRHDVLQPSSFTAPAPRDPAPVAHAAESAPTTVARAEQHATALEIPGPTVTTPSSSPRPADGGSAALPRIHVGTVEVRSIAPTSRPAPPARRAAPRADTTPISRGYAWHFGLVKG